MGLRVHARLTMYVRVCPRAFVNLHVRVGWRVCLSVSCAYLRGRRVRRVLGRVGHLLQLGERARGRPAGVVLLLLLEAQVPALVPAAACATRLHHAWNTQT